LAAGILGLLAWRLIRDWHDLPPGFFADVRYGLLLASLAALVPVLLLISLRWGLTLRAMGVAIGWWTSIRIWFVSQAGRYLPGGVWSYVGRFYLGRAEMTADAAVTSMVLETGLRVASEIIVFLASLPFWSDLGFLGRGLPLVLAIAVGLGLILLHPALLGRLSRATLLRRLGLGPVDLSRLRYRSVLALLVYYVMTVLLTGGAFYLLVVALYPLPADLLPVLTGSLAASVVLGFLVPLSPNGWGVREGMLVFLLSRTMPLPVAVVVSAAARVWLSCGEAIWILVSIRTRNALVSAK
jgi:uncharacterized membrane protein YbhN (UPF0104 family)